MSASYLLRFDDLCPTMRWSAWEGIERVLVENDIKPIASVVPDNRDPQLMVDPPDAGFWDRVRRWQSWGWTIGFHGYQHRYVTERAGLVGINRYSEFAGLSLDEQERKLEAALRIFQQEEVVPRVWVAPGHSFDATTVDVLWRLGIRTISDGLFPLPHRDRRGMLWVPQQLWRFRRMPAGVWTICVHMNTRGADGVARLLQGIQDHRQRIVDLDSVAAAYSHRRPGVTDRLAPPPLRLAKRLKQSAARGGMRRAGARPAKNAGVA
ncbi:MAG TPA: DUF2334 domain-containing protein [Actinomycetota bacterium]|nr:DUF2334 domain-containing protein [Actinomycetota bacterium]